MYGTQLGVAALIVLGAHAAHAQSSPPSQPTTNEQRLDRFEQRLNEIETKYQQELLARDQQIVQLRNELAQSRQPAPASNTAPQPPTTDQIEQTQRDILKDIQENRGSPLTLRTPASFNPDLAVVTDYRANVSTNNNNPARNRFDVGSVELDLRAAVDPRADAVAVLPVSREVEDPLFPGVPISSPGGGEDVESPGPETEIEIEEAYLFLHDFGVPNLTAKLGRFHLRFGRQNILHEHDWPTVDNNFVNQSFLGAESLNDAGISLSYVIPPSLVHDQYIEAIVEIISGEGNNEEGPVLNNSAAIDGPALNTHLLWNHDLSSDWNIELGTSWLIGKRDDDNRENADLFGADVTLIHTDPTGGFNNQLLQTEAIYGRIDTSDTATQHAFGIYLLGQQQLSRDLYLGLRLDWTENALDDDEEVWGVSPYFSWYWSEFLRFRLEYQHRDGDVDSEDTLYFQATWIFGAHPPHPYWAMH